MRLDDRQHCRFVELEHYCNKSLVYHVALFFFCTDSGLHSKIVLLTKPCKLVQLQSISTSRSCSRHTKNKRELSRSSLKHKLNKKKFVRSNFGSILHNSVFLRSTRNRSIRYSAVLSLEYAVCSSILLGLVTMQCT